MRRLTILLAALGALLLVPATQAFAEELPFKETFGSAAQPSLAEPGGVTVDPTNGDVLVVTTEGEFEAFGTIHRYKPNGEAAPFSALGSNELDGAGGEDATPQGRILGNEGFVFGGTAEYQVAVAPPGAGATAGYIYATDGLEDGVIDVFSPTGKYLSQKSFGEFNVLGVAVAPNGTVFVADNSASKVHKYTAAASGALTETNSFTVASPNQVAAGEGFIYANSFGSGIVHKIDSEGAEEGVEKYTVVSSEAKVIGLNPSNEHLFVLKAGGTETKVYEYDVSGATEATLATETSLASKHRGVAVNGPAHALYVTREGDSHVEVYSLPSTGPTNRRLLTVTKSPSPFAGTGAGTVKSKPKGINCASACDEAVASLYKETTVLISAKAATGSTLAGWEGCESTTVISATEGTCTVSMTEDQEVEAKFGGTSKAIPNPQALTLAKAGTGFGTVKSKPAGVACEADCTKAAALYAGELTEPKPKPPTTVLLTATKAPGSEFNGWSGCDSVNGEGQCVVAMSEAKEVTAEFTALPKNTLSVTKSPSPSAGTGVGTVTSKPKGIKCATACAEEQASLPEDATVVLKAKAATGSTLAGWSGCESTTVISAAEGTCTVAMATAQEVTAEFGGASKAILNPQALTLAKAGSGFGTVKSKPGGIACEADCTSSTALYAGELTEPKPKAAATVILTATSAPGSKPVAWSGCDEVNGEGQCVVSMTEAKNVTATFDELE